MTDVEIGSMPLSRAALAIARGPQGWAIRRGDVVVDAYASLRDAVAAARALAGETVARRPALIGIECQCARPILPLEWRPPKMQRR
jgi:hypothetical protein